MALAICAKRAASAISFIALAAVAADARGQAGDTPPDASAPPAASVGQALPDAPTTDASSGAADDLVAQGIRLRREGHDDRALVLFAQAYALDHSARTAAQLALAHQALAHWLEAEHGLIEALGDAADPWISRNRAYLDQSLAVAQGHLAWLEVASNAAGAEVWIGGQLAGRVPLAGPLRVVAGEMTLEVRAPPFAPIRRTMTLAGGSRDLTEFTFAPAATEPVAPDRATRAAVEGADPGRSRRTAGWVTLAVSGGLALVGAAAAITREWEARIYGNDADCGPLPSEPRSVRCGSNRDIGMAAQTVSIVTFVGAGAGAVASGILLLGAQRAPARSPVAPAPAAARFACGPAGLGLACAGVF